MLCPLRSLFTCGTYLLLALFAVLCHHWPHVLAPIIPEGTSSARGAPPTHDNSTQLIGVVDGDTLVISAPYLPQPLKPHLLLRIYGVNTPERGWRAECTEEQVRADLAYNFVHTCLFEGNLDCHTRDFSVVLRKWDKYGGRVLGDIYFYTTKLWLSEIIIKHGHGTVYMGVGPKHNWCSDEEDAGVSHHISAPLAANDASSQLCPI